MANEIYASPGTAVVFDAAGTNVAVTCTSLAAGAGRVAAQWDRGAGALPMTYLWEARWILQSGNVLGEAVDFFLPCYSVSSKVPGRLGTTDAALGSTNQLGSIRRQRIGSLVAEGNTSELIASGYVTLIGRYATLCVVNWTTGAGSATSTDFEFRLTPHPEQMQ